MSAGASSEEAERVQRRRWQSIVGLLVLGGWLACVGQWESPPPEGRQRTAAVPGAGDRLGAEICRDCHSSFGAHFTSSETHADCETCHGPAQLHVHTARARDIRYPSNADCASCHETGSTTLMGWSASAHARAGLLCSDCHDPHNREPWHLRPAGSPQSLALSRADPGTQQCAGCHPEVAAQLDLPSHHPVGEGMLACSDCHRAHEDRRDALTARAQDCLRCHQEVAGPWIYEHPPVDEDCGHCHVPHGATADFLLEITQPAACIACHTLPTSGAVHDPYAFTTRCTDCHNAVHGSYSDPHLRR